MKVFLACPPHWSVHAPPLAPALLSSALTSSGHQVVFRDLNLESFKRFLSPEWLTRARDRSEALIAAQGSNPNPSREEKARLHYIVSRMAAFPYVLENGEKAYSSMQLAENFFDIKQSLRDTAVINLALQLAVLDYFPTSFTIDDMTMPFSFFSTRQIEEACAADTCNPFIELFGCYVVPEILDLGCGMLGISINSHNQVIPGMTLARLVKLSDKNIHVCIGGSFFTKLSDRINKSHFKWVDSYILHEGEEAIVALCERLSCPDDDIRVPNAVYLDHRGRLVHEEVVPLKHLDQYPHPDFSQYRLDGYLAPQRVFPLLSSRGCYYAGCTFCGSPSILLKKYASLTSTRLTSIIRELQQKYQAKYFTFMDEAISPAFLKQFSREILRLKDAGEIGEVHFTGEIRLEKAFNKPDFIRDLRRAGFSKFLIGLESSNERLQNLISKKIDLAAGLSTLKKFIENGISIHLFFLAGFPGETGEEFRLSLERFLEEGVVQNDPLFSFFFSAFDLEKGSAVFNDPGRFGIERIITEPDEDLAINFAYEGIEPDLAERVSRAREATAEVLQALGRSIVQNPYHTMFYKAHYESRGMTPAEVLSIFTGLATDVPQRALDVSLDDETMVEIPVDMGIFEHDAGAFAFNPATVELIRLSPLELFILTLCARGHSRVSDLVNGVAEHPLTPARPRPVTIFNIQNLLDRGLLCLTA